jgi:hypothetical protein
MPLTGTGLAVVAVLSAALAYALASWLVLR